MLFTSVAAHASGEEVRADERSDLYVFAAATGGANLFDADPDVRDGRQTGAVVGVRAGLRASRPPVVPGGGRLGFMPTLELRHDLAGGRTEWLGTAAFTASMWKLIISIGLGYGFSSVRGGPPRPLLCLSNHVSMALGGLWLGLGVETSLRFGVGGIVGRTLEARLTAGWQFELFE